MSYLAKNEYYCYSSKEFVQLPRDSNESFKFAVHRVNIDLLEAKWSELIPIIQIYKIRRCTNPNDSTVKYYLDIFYKNNMGNFETKQIKNVNSFEDIAEEQIQNMLQYSIDSILYLTASFKRFNK